MDTDTQNRVKSPIWMQIQWNKNESEIWMHPQMDSEKVNFYHLEFR